MHLWNHLGCRFFRTIFTILMAWIWTGGANHLNAQSAPLPVEAAKPGVSSGPSPAETVDRLQRYFQAMEAVRRDIPRETFDIPAVVASVGNDPAGLLAWVRDHTAWVPYHGALRGPLGVLMDRRGNSLDRATLLAEMLRTSGGTVRLVHAQLSEATARKLSEGMRFTPNQPLALPLMNGRGGIDKIVKDYGDPFGLNAKNLRRAAEELFTQSERTTEEIVGRTVQQSATLAEMVWKSKEDASPLKHAANVAKDEPGQLVESLRDHWWVQFREGEKWIDMDIDPVPNSEAAASSPVEAIDWKPKEGQLSLDSKLCHEIELRVIVEKWEAGGVSEQTVLRQVLRPSQLLGQYIGVGHTALNWPGDLDLSREIDPSAKVKSLALDQHEWLPMLVVGKQMYYEGSFTDTGRVNPKADLGLFKKTGKAVVGVAAAAADILGASDIAVAPLAHGILTAEWLEYDIRVPGQPPRQIRRQVFDLLGPAARGVAGAIAEPTIDDGSRLGRGLSLLGQIEILPLACQLSPAFVNDMMARNALAMKNPLIKVFGAPDDPAAKDSADPLAQLPPLPSRLYDLALERQFLNPDQSSVYFDRPNVLSLHQFLRNDAARGLMYCVGIDIVANEVAVRPDLGPARVLTTRLMQGVIDTNAETLLMDEGVRSGTVSDQLARQPDADQWLVLHDRNDPAWQKTVVPGDVRARIDTDLAQGYTVIFPQQAALLKSANAIGWWRIDPKTGQTLGINGQGWGAAAVEYVGVGLVFFNACMVGATAVGKFGPNAPSNGKSLILCAIGGLGFGACAAAGTTAIALKLFVAAAATGGAAGGAF